MRLVPLLRRGRSVGFTLLHASDVRRQLRTPLTDEEPGFLRTKSYFEDWRQWCSLQLPSLFLRVAGSSHHCLSLCWSRFLLSLFFVCTCIHFPRSPRFTPLSLLKFSFSCCHSSLYVLLQKSLMMSSCVCLLHLIGHFIEVPFVSQIAGNLMSPCLSYCPHKSAILALYMFVIIRELIMGVWGAESQCSGSVSQMS